MRRLAPLLSLALILATGIPARAQQPLFVARATTLPVELKDPFTAYTLGLVPGFSFGAANYVGTTRLKWDPDPSLKFSAMTQTLADLALLAAGIYLYQRGTVEAPTTSTSILAGSAGAFAAIPLTHLWFYAPFWGQNAVEFNRKRLEQEGFSTNEPK